ncbi:hypothetical protein HPB48_013604 [Haemaphysalis longicornis]|uniref:Uncharacterized protein n=1 Tax=Haemaphysalis longicornis TaxID=44386 RepID=A0A9J6FXX3_HAELO|nr:hypothetical protein HPB48_013604 [Haemaphysalis longicornis]
MRRRNDIEAVMCPIPIYGTCSDLDNILTLSCPLYTTDSTTAFQEKTGIIDQATRPHVSAPVRASRAFSVAPTVLAGQQTEPLRRGQPSSSGQAALAQAVLEAHRLGALALDADPGAAGARRQLRLGRARPADGTAAAARSSRAIATTPISDSTGYSNATGQ